MVGNGVGVAVDKYGITTNVYLVYYEGTEVETKNIFGISFTFYTIDEKFVQFLYANSK